MEKVDSKIKLLQTTLKKWRPRKQVLKEEEVQKELHELQDKYVFLPIDKASNNIGLMCKQYYYEVINKETLSDTYKEVAKSASDVIKDIKKKCNDVGFTVPEEHLQLPFIYATIKMHKKPVKFRYIVASSQCVLKTIAQKLTKILQLVQDVHRKYCRKIYLYTGINRMWIADNSKKFLEDIHIVNRRKSARNIATYDFSTLYTKLPPEDLKSTLKRVVDKAFKGGRNQFISISNNSAKWSNKEKDTYTKEDIYNMIDLIIDNTYFQFGNKVYHQIIGLPMGIDPAPPAANLYLYDHEFNWIEKLTKRDYGKAKKYNNAHRYIDDLSLVNNDGHLASNIPQIYPKELILNKENKDDLHATFLDLDISIEDKVIRTKTYDKRDDFKFEIINYPHLSSNIPTKQAYGVIISESLRHFRNSTNEGDAIEKIKTLVNKLIQKEYKLPVIRSTIKKTLERHQWIQKKYNCNSEYLYRKLTA